MYIPGLCNLTMVIQRKLHYRFYITDRNRKLKFPKWGKNRNFFALQGKNWYKLHTLSIESPQQMNYVPIDAQILVNWS